MRWKLVFAIILLVLIDAPSGAAFAESLPEAAMVPGITGRAQTYNLSCESRSAADLAAYWGVSVAETDFFASLPASDDPNVGFVGNVHGRWGNVPPLDYGVHAPPVAAQLRAIGLDAADERGMTWEAMRAEIAAGRPAIVWIIGAIWDGSALPYVPASGEATIVAPFEHTMILIGYSPNTVTLIDAANGAVVGVSQSAFLASWAVLGNMAVTVAGRLDASVAPPRPTAVPEPAAPTQSESVAATDAAEIVTYIVQPGDRLASIADRAGTTWPELARLNNLFAPYMIYAGQTLILHGATAPAQVDPSPTTYVVQIGDQLGRIAARLGVDWVAMAQLNGLVAPYVVYVGQSLRVPSGGAVPDPVQTAPSTGMPDSIVVQPGETLSQIAGRYGLGWQDLAWLNGIYYPYQIYAYQTLRLR